MQTTATAPSAWMRRAAPLGGAVAIGVATLIVATNDPSAAGSHFPACAFHSATGLWCPGCGLTRGLHALLTGHVGTALSSNVFTPFAAVAVVWLLVSWMRVAWERPALRLPRRVERWLMIVAPVLVFGYGLLRNIPVAPFRSLAP